MAIDTKPNFSCKKFEQCADDVMNLSGCTQIYGTFDLESGSTLTICDNVGAGKVLTSDATGIGTWQTPAEQGITAISGGSGMNFSPITTTGSVALGAPSTITSGSTNVSSGTTHNHCHDSNTFATGNQGILVDANNRFYLDDTYVTNVTLADLNTYTGVTSNQSIGTLNSGDTLGMVYLTNSGSSTAYINLGTTATGDDITPYQTIQVDANEDVSVTVNMRLSETENKLMYISSDDWTNVELRVQWANITYQNASSSIDPSDLPIATTSTLGAIIVGSGLDIDGAGVLSSNEAVTGATNLGSGLGQIYASEIDDTLQFKTLSGGTNITITTDANYIGINSTGGGAGSAANGLCVCGDNMTLGGALTGQTTVAGGTTCSLALTQVNAGDSAYIKFQGEGIIDIKTFSDTEFGTSETGLQIDCENVRLIANNGTNSQAICIDGAMTISDAINSKGLVYGGAYKGNFSCHSLVDVDYVTGLTSGGSGGFLGTVTKASAEPTDLQSNQWVKPEPMSTDCFNYTFDNFLDSGSTAINVNLSLEDVYLRYDEDNTAWVKESYLKPLSSGYTWVGNATCNAAEVVVVNEWVSSAAELCYVGQKFAYDTQTIFQVDVGCCVTMPNKIFSQNINLDTVANTCLFTIPSGKTAMIDSAKLIMLCNASPTSLSVSIGNNACSTASLSYKNMISTHTIDDVSLCEVYDIMPVLGGAGCCDGSCLGADVYFRVQSGSTCGNDLCAHLLIEGYVF